MKAIMVIAILGLLGAIALFLIVISSNDYERDGHYYSPSGKYNFPVPKSSIGSLKTTKGAQSLSFTNDWCELYRIDYGFIPEQIYQESKQVSRKTFLEHGLRNVYIATFLQPKIPEGAISVDYIEYMHDVFNGSLYAQLDVPKGSVCVVRHNGGVPAREDAKRGVLVVTYGNRLYIITTALDVIATGLAGMPASSGFGEKKWSDMQRQKLMMKTLEFAKTFKFNVTKAEYEKVQEHNK